MSVRAAPISPYKGLAPFERTALDAMLFFGRDRATEIVIANLMAYRLTVLYGASGVGKSSLLRAGVAYDLEQRGEAVVVFGRWSGDPAPDLLEEVRATLGLESGSAGPDHLTDVLAGWTGEFDRELYLVLDQFDEYFLYHDERDTFAEQFAELVTRPGVRVNVVVATRDDMLARLDLLKSRIPNLFSNYLRLEHLDRDAARDAIVRPLDRLDLEMTVEPRLVEAVLDQTGTDDGRVEAPYLQLVMRRLWEEERTLGSTVLRAETLDRLGGAPAIVQTHFRSALEGLSPEERELAAGLFNQLVTPSGTKIAHGLVDLAQYSAAPEDELVPVLSALSDERIIRPVEARGPSGPQYEIFHDVLVEPVLAWRSAYENERNLLAAGERARRRHRQLLLGLGAAVVTIGLLLALTIYALTQRSEARTEARRSHAAALGATALAERSSDPQASLRLAVEAARLAPSSQIESALRTVLLDAHERAVLPEKGRVSSLVVDPTGSRFASVAGATAYLCEPSGRLVRKIPGAEAVAFSPDGRMLGVAGRGSVQLLRARDGGFVRTFRSGADSIAFGGQYVAAGSVHRVRVWGRDGRLVAVFHAPGLVTGVEVSPDGSRSVALGQDVSGRSRAWLFVPRTGRLVRTLPATGIVTAAFSPAGSLLATGGVDRTARLWDAQSGALRRTLTNPGHVVALSFSRDGALLATASSDGAGRVWSTATGERLLILAGPTQPATDVSLSYDARFLLLTSADRNAYIYDVANGRLVVTLSGSPVPLVAGDFTPVTLRVVTAGGRTLRIWDPGVADQLRFVEHVRTPVTASFGPGGTISVHPIAPEAPVTARSADGRLTARANGETVIVSGAVSRRLRNGAPVTAVRFGPDGRLLVTSGRDGAARVWSVASGRVLHVLRGHFGPVEDASFSPDGRWIVTAGPSAAILWDASTGENVSYLRGHAALTPAGKAATLTSAAFSPDGRRIVTASTDGTVRIYRCEVCGNLDSLIRLGESRLARITPPR